MGRVFIGPALGSIGALLVPTFERVTSEHTHSSRKLTKFTLNSRELTALTDTQLARPPLKANHQLAYKCAGSTSACPKSNKRASCDRTSERASEQAGESPAGVKSSGAWHLAHTQHTHSTLKLLLLLHYSCQILSLSLPLFKLIPLLSPSHTTDLASCM